MNIEEKMKGFIGTYKLAIYANAYDPKAGFIDNLKRYLNRTFFFKFITKEAPLSVDSYSNKITNVSLAVIAARIGGITATGFGYLALGTSSTAVSAAHTALQAEISTSGLQRISVTPTQTTVTQTNDTLSYAGLWTASGSVTIEELGVFNASSVGTMLSRVLTTTKAVISGQTVRLTYTLQVVGN